MQAVYSMLPIGLKLYIVVVFIGSSCKTAPFCLLKPGDCWTLKHSTTYRFEKEKDTGDHCVPTVLLNKWIIYSSLPSCFSGFFPGFTNLLIRSLRSEPLVFWKVSTIAPK